jgi:hypothetical protein
VALALEAFARGKVDCWPTNQTIADLVGCSVRTVQLCLASLERLGWLRRSHDPRAKGRGGDVLLVGWRDVARTASSRLGSDSAPSSSEGRNRLQGDGANGCGQGAPLVAPELSSGIIGTNDVTSPARPIAPQTTPPKAEALSLEQAIGKLPTDPELTETVAMWLGADLADLASLPYYRRCAARVAKGEAPPDRLRAACLAARVATNDHRIRKPGAIFSAAWNAYRPRLTESQARERDEAKATATSSPPVALHKIGHKVEPRIDEQIQAAQAMRRRLAAEPRIPTPRPAAGRRSSGVTWRACPAEPTSEQIAAAEAARSGQLQALQARRQQQGD